jgi:hypothetical protein
LLLVVDLSPLVMAIWPEWAIRDIHGRFRKEPERAAKRKRAVLVQEERPYICLHVHPRLSLC